MPTVSKEMLLFLVFASAAAPGCSTAQPTQIEISGNHPVVEEPRPEGPPWLEDVTDSVGLDFVQDPGPTGTFFMPQSMGSGCAVIRDEGALYLYLLHSAGPGSKSVNRLFRRTPQGKFEDVSRGSGLDVAGWNSGVAVGDVNNDGHPDVLLTQYGGIRLFLGLGAGKFVDVTDKSGLSNPLWAASAAFFDYDRDGWLDLVVVNYVDYDPKHDCYAPNGGKDFCGPVMMKGTCSKLFHNRGAKLSGSANQPWSVSFEDVSFASGVGRISGPGLGVVCADFDGDGWPDIFVSNDGQPNRLWMNKKDGTFTNEAISRGAAYNSMGKAFAGMGIALGDVNNDLMLDLFVAHLNTETNTLWQQGPRGQFQEATAEAGLTARHWRYTGFGTALADFDLDGALDIAVVNGRVYLGGPAKNTDLGFWETYAERNQLFANGGAGKFRDVSIDNPSFCKRWNVARGLAVVDYDDDGAPDLLITTIGGPARLFRNVAPRRGHWLTVRAIDPGLKRDAYGAEIVVKFGGVERLRLINAAGSFLSSSEPAAMFGLGPSAAYESIRVKWPDTTIEVFEGGKADTALVLKKGEGRRP